MGYRAIEFIDENYYHVYSRGNEKRAIFLSDRDYIRFLDKLKEYSEQDKVSILCYCLMPNHYHTILKQLNSGSITNFIHRLQTSYAMYFNLKNDRVGHLFQGPFKAKLIEEDAYMLQVSRYIHLNPQDIRKDPIKYRWSSLKSYLNLTRSEMDIVLQKELIYDYFDHSFPVKAYKEFVFLADEFPDDILAQE